MPTVTRLRQAHSISRPLQPRHKESRDDLTPSATKARHLILGLHVSHLLHHYHIQALTPSRPTGAGIFSGKVTRDSIHRPDGRWSHSTPIGHMWSSVYFKDEILTAADKVRTGAEKVGISGHDAALRWVLHHSVLRADMGDAMLIGAASMDQLRQNLGACDAGPLPDHLVEIIDGIWPSVEPVSPWAWMDGVPSNAADSLKVDS
jgi:hypothetical protein